jgi:hypothetical protein
VVRSDCRRSHISVARGSSLRQSAISCSGPDSSVYHVEVLDETRMSLSVKEERLMYIDVPRRNTYESRDEIISIRSKETK